MNKSWKRHEREAAKKLNGRRLLRGDDFSLKRPDVISPLLKGWQIDCKYRKRFKVWTLFRDIEEKYGVPAMLILKERGRHGELVTLRLEDFVKLLREL